MKMKALNKALPLAFAIAVLVGCSTTDTDDSADTGSFVDDTSASTMTSTLDTNDGVSSSSINDGSDQDDSDTGMVELESVVYFEFDKATLLPEARALLNAHAERLKNSGLRIVLEGHADERGTREYNLALGERRAQSVESYLAIQGVAKSQMESVSYGEEKPVAYGSNEDSWAKNRRVEIRL